MTAESNASYSPLPQSLNSSASEDEDDEHHELERNDSIISRETDQSRISVSNIKRNFFEYG